MTLTVEQNASVRATVRRLLGEFEGNMTKLARYLDVSQSLISQFLAGKTGAGIKLLRNLSKYSGKPIDEILGQQRPDLADRVEDLEYEVAELRAENAKLKEAVREGVYQGEKHKKLLRQMSGELR